MKYIMTLLLLSYTTIYAQSSIVTAGETAFENNCSVSYSLGQVFYQHYEYQTDAMVVNEGVQQPYEIEEAPSVDETQEDLLQEYTSSQLDDKKNLKYSLTVYPNPAITQITLDIDQFNRSGDYTYQIRNTNGQLVRLNSVTHSSTKIDISALNDGLFYLTVLQDTQVITTFKLLKFNN